MSRLTTPIPSKESKVTGELFVAIAHEIIKRRAKHGGPCPSVSTNKARILRKTGNVPGTNMPRMGYEVPLHECDSPVGDGIVTLYLENSSGEFRLEARESV